MKMKKPTVVECNCLFNSKISLPSIRKSRHCTNVQSSRTQSSLSGSNEDRALIKHCKKQLYSKLPKRKQLEAIIHQFEEAVAMCTDYQRIFHIKIGMIEIIITFGDYHKALALLSELV